MTPLEIKILLLRKGLTVSGIAREMGARRDMVSQQIHGHYEYPHLRRELKRRYGIICPPPKQKEKKAA